MKKLILVSICLISSTVSALGVTKVIYGKDDRVDVVEFVGKRPRKEIDFNLGKMESHLARALAYAKEGSKDDLETYLRLAKTNAEIC